MGQTFFWVDPSNSCVYRTDSCWRDKRGVKQCYTVLHQMIYYFFFLTHSSQCGDVTCREILKTTKPGLLSESCRLLTRCSPASVSEVTEQSGLHRCSPGARPGTLVSPGPPPVFFFFNHVTLKANSDSSRTRAPSPKLFGGLTIHLDECARRLPRCVLSRFTGATCAVGAL